jgi:uncharacterized repeat protein (TIGR02543 family)
MNRILSSLLHHRITRPAISLLMVALIATMTGCVNEAGQTAKYSLTIASGEGGSVTTPGEGTFTVDSGRVIDLTATPALGYRFLKWTGSVGTIANVNAASTTITMSGNYSITANFEQTEMTYYTLTVGLTGGGSASPVAGAHTYAAGTVVSISATPSSGYHFVNWTGNVASIANVNAASTTITVNGDYSITANFEQTIITYYTLTMAATAGGSISPAVGQHSYAAGTPIPVVAIPDGGYQFVNWTASAGSFANPSSTTTTFTMPAQNVTITANFVVAVAYTMTMVVTGSGSTSPAVGPHIYTADTSVAIVATPALGYSFVSWTAPAGSFTNAGSTATTFTMPAQNVTVTANFVEGPPFPPGQYTLTMAVTGSGSTSPSIGQHTYTAGTLIPIAATPAGGYSFVNWTAPAGSFTNANSASTMFTMPAQDVAVTAHFQVIPPVQYTLTMAVTGSGSTSPGVGPHTYAGGTSVPIAATPAGGYSFVNWTAPAGSFADAGSASTTFTMPAQNVTVTAHFGLISTYALTMAVTPPGSGTATDQTGAGPYQTGAHVSIKAEASAGYYFVNWTALAGSFTNSSSATTTFTMPPQAVTVTAHFELVNFMVSAGALHTVGLKSDGTVLAVGDNEQGQCNVGGWTDITQVAAGGFHTAGLESGSTVVAAGNNIYGQCDVNGWANIVQVSAGGYHTVGLKSDGTVVAVGYNYYGQCDVGTWTNIIQVAAGGFYTLGLKSNGTVVAVGDNSYGQCNVGGWTNIIQVSAGNAHTVGLRSNGTVVAVGDNERGQCNVGAWTNIMEVSSGGFHTVGLRVNGTAIAAGDNHHGECDVSGWTGIIQINAGWQFSVGLKSDGTVLAIGWNGYGQLNVGGWNLT